MSITIFKRINQVHAGFYRDVYYALDRIKNGNSKSHIGLIRDCKDKKDRDELKKEYLPAICFSGTFSSRQDHSLKTHSGYICLDFDAFENQKILKEFREKIQKDEYVFSSFLSPSGEGLKVLIKVPPEIKHHRDYFRALQKYFDCKYFDKSCINESRACYESYDPDLYLNENSLIWLQREEVEEVKIFGNDKPVIQLKTENEIIKKLLVWFNKNYDMKKGVRNNNLFILASALNDFGIPMPAAESVLNQYKSKDFDRREIENTIKSAYSNKINFATKFFEDETLRFKIEKQIRAGSSEKDLKKTIKEYGIDNVGEVIESIKGNLAISEFWYYDFYGELKLIPHKYKQFLEQNGFYKYYPIGNENYIFVKIEENLVSDTNSSRIKDFVLDYLYSGNFGLKPYDFMASATKYFKDDYLSFLDTANIDFKDDTQDKCYLYYKNCAIEITKDGIKEVDYIELSGFVWKKHIIDREFKQLDIDIVDNCEFKQFLTYIAGQETENFNSMLSVIGYLLHSYKSSSKNRAIIFNDEVISEIPNGGSGKGIICNAISKIKRTTFIDGKQFDFNKSFPYQTVSADTQTLVFDDVKKNFNFENLFSLVTEGITLEKKNKDAIKLPVYKSPKIVITTNYTVKGIGGSFERRKFEVELSSFFGVNKTPFEIFGHMLFDDWDISEWLKFDNFMIFCVQFFLNAGLVEHEYKNLETRKFINQTCYEFYEWVEEEDNLPINEQITRSELLEKYLEEFPDQRKFVSHKRFANWLHYYCIHKGFELIKTKSNGIRYIRISETKYVDNQLLNDF